MLGDFVPQPHGGNAFLAVLAGVHGDTFGPVLGAFGQGGELALELALLLDQVVLAGHVLGADGPYAAGLEGVPEGGIH